jgi:uncharacterized protein
VTTVTTMLTWQAEDGRSLESARLLFGPGHTLRALSRLVRVDPGGDYTASFRLVVREDGTVGRLSVTSATAGKERHLTLNLTEDGSWLLDTGSGGARTDFQGAVDVDLAGSPVLNSLPIRRLGLHKQAGEHTIKVAYVDLPELEATLVEQRYRTVSVDADGAVVEFTQGDFTAEITVDVDGLVIAYPGIANRISASPAATSSP